MMNAKYPNNNGGHKQKQNGCSLGLVCDDIQAVLVGLLIAYVLLSMLNYIGNQSGEWRL